MAKARARTKKKAAKKTPSERLADSLRVEQAEKLAKKGKKQSATLHGCLPDNGIK